MLLSFEERSSHDERRERSGRAPQREWSAQSPRPGRDPQWYRLRSEAATWPYGSQGSDTQQSRWMVPFSASPDAARIRRHPVPASATWDGRTKRRRKNPLTRNRSINPKNDCARSASAVCRPGAIEKSKQKLHIPIEHAPQLGASHLAGSVLHRQKNSPRCAKWCP
jgi:hypothetical protein